MQASDTTVHPQVYLPQEGTESGATEPIEHLASLTSQRDREMLDISLAQGVLALLPATSVGVYRLIGHDGEPRRWMCAGLARKGQLTVSDSSWVDLASLPFESSFPTRQRVLHLQGLDQRTLPDSEGQAEPGYVSTLPLVVELGAPGVLEVHSAQPLSLAALRPILTLLKVFANFQNLLESSQRDALTGLLNRQTFDATMIKSSVSHVAADHADSAQGDRRVTEATSYWLGVIDIDHFKRVNDSFGHLIGDEVLVVLARIMRQCFRHYDRLYRFGGEEFVVFLRGGTEADAHVAFERFRCHVASYVFPQVNQLTVSIGFTEVLHHDTPTAAFARADQGVYQAKRRGRNQVLCFEAELRNGRMHAEGDFTGDVEFF